MNVFILCVFVILTLLTKTEASGLSPGGTNVETSYEKYSALASTITRTVKYRKTCRQTCAFWIFGCRTVCRTKSIYSWKTVYKPVTKYRPVYKCKSGWKQDGNECTIPICTGGCQNNGKCTAPDVCKCTLQWNGKNCKQDVNECDSNSGIRHGCQDTCVNFPGGYRCDCTNGFNLTSNGKNCSDHDECAGNIHNCQQKCINYPGGYTCACRPGYTLNNNDNKTCDGHQCEKLVSPTNGKMQCTGNTTDHSCSFTCNPGYDLRGSSNRSCNASGKWTGDETMCEIIHCQKPLAPRHGFVYTPCDTPFGSECIVGCMRGYFMKEKGKITCNATGVWYPDNLSCTKTTACERDPCEHNGICIPLSSSRYVCDCSKTGYQGINCQVGSITTPKYPRITVGTRSSLLEFKSSPLNSGKVVLVPSSRDVTFNPIFLVFNATSSHHSLTVASNRTGAYFIKYSIYGSKASEFVPPGNDLVFVDSINNSTNQTMGNSTTNVALPKGCYEFVLKKCPASNRTIVSSSTAPWQTTGVVTSSSGVIVLHAGKTNLPLSLFGTSLPNSAESRKDKRCEAGGNCSTEELAKHHILTKSFLKAIEDSFPQWLTANLRRETTAKSFHSSDVKTQFLSGLKLRKTPTGEGQPITDDSSFSLLQSSNINLTLENDEDILSSHHAMNSRVLLAVDLCSEKPKTIILRVPDECVSLIKNASVFRRLKRSGWEMTVYSLQISKTNSIQTPFRGERFWDGKKLVSGNVNMKGSLALLTKLKKAFTAGDLNSYLEFYGTAVIFVNDLNTILTSPLHQTWLVDLYGNLKLTIQLAIEGKKTNLTLNTAASVSFATFGDNPETAERNAYPGLYVSHSFETSPFVNTELGRFIETSSKDHMEVFLKTRLQSMPANNVSNPQPDFIEELNMVFPGVLKFGLLRFKDMSIILKTQNKIVAKVFTNGITVTGKARTNATENYGIFEANNLELQLHVSDADRGASFGSFQSNVDVLGFSGLVSVTFGVNGLSFNTSGKVHGKFLADLNCVSPLDSWKKQRFLASGMFRPGNNSLMNALSHVFYDNARQVYSRALKRKQFFEGREERAKNRLDSLSSVLEEKQQELNKSQVEYEVAKENLENAEMHFKNLQSNASQKVKAHLDDLCPEVKDCPDICQAGVVCKQCIYTVLGKSKRTCLSTCYKTETRRIETNSTFVPCQRQQCDRIYLKDGLVRNTVQSTLTSLQNDIFSLGKKAASFSGSLNGLKGGLFPGERKQDVCQYAETTSSMISEELCETDDRNGHWNCSVRTEACSSTGFRFDSYHAPYTCERPCESHVSTENITRSCCETVPCAFKTVNRSCVVKNRFCNRVRIDALEKNLTTNTSSERDLLRQVEMARGELLYWQIKARKAEIRLKSAKALLNLTQKTARSLLKAYNMSVESKHKISSLLAKKLNLKWLFDKNTSGIRFDSASFKVEIQEGGNYLIPVRFNLSVNGTEEVFSAIVNFRALNSSLGSITKDILESYGNGKQKNEKSRRKRRSVESGVKGYALSSLQKYHRLCSDFINYERAIHDMLLPLLNLTSEAKELLKNASIKNTTDVFNASKIFENFNTSKTTSMGLDVDKELYIKNLENDRIMLAAAELESEARDDGFKPLFLNSRLLFRNWFTAMENIFSEVLRNCSGFEDCIVFITDGLMEMNEASRFPGRQKVRRMIVYLRKELDRLTMNPEIAVEEAYEVSWNVLKTLKDIREVKLFCARAPNITKQPEPFTDIGEGKPLALTCNATGDSLDYSWKFNEIYLSDQTGNTLLIPNVFSGNSGNYTCIVTNHISKETSTPAFVMVHPAPTITVQPIQRLNATISTNDSLRCLAETTDNNITYQWYFKSSISSTFTKLSGQVFPYLNFAPVELVHEGWYYCNVTNFYAARRSRISYVKVLNYALSVPLAKLFISLTQSTKRARYSKRSTSNSIGYDEIQAKLAKLLSLSTLNRNASVNSSSDSVNSTSSSVNGTSNQKNGVNSSMQFNPQVKDLHIVQCNAVETAKVCQWVFQYVGKNVSGNGHNTEQNANKVIGSLRELRAAIGRLIQATNDGVLAFDLADQRFSVEKNSVSVENVFTACSSGTKLQQDFRCVHCPPGNYGETDENDIATCIPCRVGTYQPDSGQTACTPCPEGFTTVHTGSIDKSQCQVICSAGSYGKIADNIGKCLDCPRNTYQPSKGQFDCLKCPDGHVTDSEGASELSQCYPEQTTTQSSTTTRKSVKTTPETVETTREEKNRLTTREEEPTPGDLNDSDGGNHTSAIGGAVGAFLFLCLMALVLIYLLWRRRTARKSREPLDDKTIVVSNNELELNSWNNPGFEEGDDDGVDTGHMENPIYVSDLKTVITTENAIYDTAHKGNTGFQDINLDTEEDAADLKIHGSYENGDVTTHYGNPLYVSNPAQDSENEFSPGESEGKNDDSGAPASAFNPLYEVLEKEQAHKNTTFKLDGDAIVDEDV